MPPPKTVKKNDSLAYLLCFVQRAKVLGPSAGSGLTGRIHHRFKELMGGGSEDAQSAQTLLGRVVFRHPLALSWRTPILQW